MFALMRFVWLFSFEFAQVHVLRFHLQVLQGTNGIIHLWKGVNQKDKQRHSEPVTYLIIKLGVPPELNTYTQGGAISNSSSMTKKHPNLNKW